MKRVFEIFYRKRIALITAPLQSTIDELRADLSRAREHISDVELENRLLQNRVHELNLALAKANQGNGLTRSQYITVVLPNPVTDSEGNPLRGEYRGHKVDYDLVCKAREGILILRSDHSDAGKIELEVVGSGVVEIIINQRMVVDGTPSVSYKPFALFEVVSGSSYYQIQECYSFPLSMMLEQARMTVNHLDSNS